MSIFKALGDRFRKRFSNEQSKNDPADANEDGPVCCSNTVHIAFRGKSDDRLYLSRNRDWTDVRYFKPNGLRVFCSQCRRRVL